MLLGLSDVRQFYVISGNLSDTWLDISSLQTPSGVFAGDQFGETDTRFSFCAINALSLLDRKYITPGTAVIDVDKVIDHITRCRNFDGGFGSDIGGESHAAQGEQVKKVAPLFV